MDLKQFKEIPEHPNYLISREGKVYSLISNKLLSIRTNSNGYLYFGVNNGCTNLLLSRALARVYLNLPSLDSALQVDHDDNNKLNNELSNLIVRTSEDHALKTILERGNTVIGTSRCSTCGIEITSGASRCRKHYILSKISKDISIKDIEYWVSNYSWVRASKELGLSDNGLRKRYKSLTGLDPKSIKKPS